MEKRIFLSSGVGWLTLLIVAAAGLSCGWPFRVYILHLKNNLVTAQLLHNIRLYHSR